jgi:hypothetical protein
LALEYAGRRLVYVLRALCTSQERQGAGSRIRNRSLSRFLETARLFLRPFLNRVLICKSTPRCAQLYPALNVLCGHQACLRKLSGRRDMGGLQSHAGVGHLTRALASALVM